MNPAAKRDLTDGERRRLRSEWVDGTLTQTQLCARFRISGKRLLEEVVGLSRLMDQYQDHRRQVCRIARALL